MLRRDFLKTTSAAAAASVAAGTAAAEAATSVATSQATAHATAPALHLTPTRLVLAAGADADAATSPARQLARRIETVSAGRIAVAVSTVTAAPGADLTLVGTHEHTRHHPAFAFFAGLPGGLGLDAADLPAWLAIGGGQMLWDELAASHGFKPLLAGHTGPGAGLWSNRALEAASNLTGVRIAATGLAAAALRALGAETIGVPPGALKAALAESRIDAAEWLGPLAAVAPDMRPLADRLYTPAPTPSGMTVTLAVQSARWHGLSAAEQAILEVCALAEYHAALADARAHALLQRHAGYPLQRLALPSNLAAALDRAARDAVETLAASDPVTGRIADSHRMFRTELTATEPATA